MSANRICVVGCVVCLAFGVIALVVPISAGAVAFGVVAIGFAQLAKIIGSW